MTRVAALALLFTGPGVMSVERVLFARSFARRDAV